MTDSRLAEMVRELGERNVPAWVEDGKRVRVPLQVGYVEVELTGVGWEARTVGAPDLDWRVRWVAPSGVGGTPYLILLLRQLPLIYPPDQGRGVADGPLSGPESPGSGGPGGEGAGEIENSAGRIPRRYEVLADLGFWTAVAGVVGFALLDELEVLNSARALGGAFLVGAAGAAFAVWAVRRGSRASG